ncbi:unnamed protein product, partial [Prorocentrum cordatum]
NRRRQRAPRKRRPHTIPKMAEIDSRVWGGGRGGRGGHAARGPPGQGQRG